VKLSAAAVCDVTRRERARKVKSCEAKIERSTRARLVAAGPLEVSEEGE
jgi:hypothetical protein